MFFTPSLEWVEFLSNNSGIEPILTRSSGNLTDVNKERQLCLWCLGAHVVEIPSWLQSTSGNLAKADRLRLTLGRRMEWSADDTLRRDTQECVDGSRGHLQMAGMQRRVCQEWPSCHPWAANLAAERTLAKGHHLQPSVSEWWLVLCFVVLSTFLWKPK